MAKTKVTAFDKNLVKIAQTAKALSHPARLKILMLLAEKNACICGELVKASPLAQSTVSQHIKELKTAGLIEGETEGPKTCYCLNKKAVAVANKAVSQFFSLLKRQNKTEGGKCRNNEQ